MVTYNLLNWRQMLSRNKILCDVTTHFLVGTCFFSLFSRLLFLTLENTSSVCIIITHIFADVKIEFILLSLVLNKFFKLPGISSKTDTYRCVKNLNKTNYFLTFLKTLIVFKVAAVRWSWYHQSGLELYS